MQLLRVALGKRAKFERWGSFLRGLTAARSDLRASQKTGDSV